jgi:hypothetical protein
VAETVRGTDGSAFYFSEDTFDYVPISIFLVSEIVASPVTGSLQRVRSIDEKHRVANVMFLAYLSEKRFCETGIYRRLKTCMQQFVRL